MKSLLLAICIAAIATPASARPWAAFYCGKVQVCADPRKIFRSHLGKLQIHVRLGQTHYFDSKNDPEHKRPLSKVRNDSQWRYVLQWQEMP